MLKWVTSDLTAVTVDASAICRLCLVPAFRRTRGARLPVLRRGDDFDDKEAFLEGRTCFFGVDGFSREILAFLAGAGGNAAFSSSSSAFRLRMADIGCSLVLGAGVASDLAFLRDGVGVKSPSSSLSGPRVVRLREAGVFKFWSNIGAPGALTTSAELHVYHSTMTAHQDHVSGRHGK